MSNDSSDPFAWADLLKWSLNYVDGTSDSSDAEPMSDEDKAFLEKVMKEGIIDEGERMRDILKEFSQAMEYYRKQSQPHDAPPVQPISEEKLENMLQELRDIVEQIDYARAFCSLQGLPFLLGCVAEPRVPVSIRQASLGILATMCQNNPPVQKQMLDLGGLKVLSDLYLQQDASNSLRAKLMQAISSVVRNHDLAENVFCHLEQSPSLFTIGLDSSSSSQNLRSRSLFFLRALVTSDSATSSRAYLFRDAIGLVSDYYAQEDSVPDDLKELTIGFLDQLLEQERGVNLILDRKDALASRGVQRIATLRSLAGEDRDFFERELSHWEDFVVRLARAQQQEETKEEPLLLKST